jgi:uncharacterized membrane protein
VYCVDEFRGIGNDNAASVHDAEERAMRHFVLGCILIVLGIWGMFTWWESFGRVMRGVLPFVLLSVGLVALMSSYYRFTERDLGLEADAEADADADMEEEEEA